MALQHLRSNTASKRPTAAAMSDGQIAVNTNATSPGLFFKDAGGTIVKVGPVHVGTSAPNSSPAAGGSTGNSVGEQWLDTSGGSYVFKVWDGSAWRSEAGEFVDVAGDTMTGDLTISGADLVMSNGEIIAATGTASSPSIAFSGDTDTGFYSPGANQVALATNGTGRLFVDASGDVGINIGSPSAKLDVVGQFKVRASTPGAYALVEYGDSATATNNWHVGTEGDGTFRFYNGLFGAGSERLRITSDGKVGIGTTSPDATLNVRAGSDNSSAEEIASFSRPDAAVRAAISKGLISGTTNGIAFGTTTNHPFALNTNGTERLYITDAGNVGIGTTSPSQKLQVSGGNILVDSNNALRFGSSDAAFIEGSGSDGTGGTRYMRFAVNNEAARIDSSGRLLVGTSSWAGGYSTQIIAGNTASATGPGVLYLTRKSANPGNGSTLGELKFSDSNGSLGASIVGWSDDAWASGDYPGRLTFSTTSDAGSTPVERMRITSDGNVGIGTTSPGSLLQLTKTDVTAYSSIATDGQVGVGPTIYLLNPANSNTIVGGQIVFGMRSTESQCRIGATGGSSPELFFGTNDAERMRILSNGNVGIGTTAPGQKLSINEGTNTDPADVSGLAKGTIFLSNSGGTTGQNNYGCSIAFSRINTTRRGAMIASKQMTTDPDQQGLAFFTRGSTNTSSDAVSERVLIDHNGNVGIGIVPQTPLHVSGITRIGTLAGTGNRAVYSAPSGSLTNDSSDATLKTNVATLGNQSEVVKRLRPVTYNWIDTEERGEQQEIGFIAQEVQPLVPQVIGVNHDETLCVDYPKLTAVLTKALQEAMERIETLEQRLTDAGL